QEYRAKIQTHLNGLIKRLSVDRETARPLLILSHSLGTVIALDSLLSSGIWPQDAQITFVTLGSPIRRFFMRFFPGTFFPGSITAAVASVAQRMSGFRWINCYRPFDQVGAALGLYGIAYARDISTKQWRRIWNAHPDYWSDDHVRNVIINALQNTPMHSVSIQGQRPRVALQDYVATDLVDFVEKFRQAIVSGVFRVSVTAFLLAPVVAGGFGASF